MGGVSALHDYYQEYVLKFEENMRRKVEETMEKQRQFELDIYSIKYYNRLFEPLSTRLPRGRRKEKRTLHYVKIIFVVFSGWFWMRRLANCNSRSWTSSATYIGRFRRCSYSILKWDSRPAWTQAFKCSIASNRTSRLSFTLRSRAKVIILLLPD